jgi:hypothetical protein
VLAVPIVVIADHLLTQAVGRTTTVTESDGRERTVYWREYPGVAGLDADDVLDGPSVDEGYAAGAAMVAEIRAALTAEFGLEWSPTANHDSGNGPFFDRVANGFGGESLLTTINAAASQSTTVPSSWAEKERVIEIIGEVTATYGFSAPVLDHDRDTSSSADERIRDWGGSTPETQVFVSGVVKGPTGQWLFFHLQDLSHDVDGRFADRPEAATANGWPPNTVSFAYGANALLPDEHRDEFERRLQPFRGLTPPPALAT